MTPIDVIAKSVGRELIFSPSKCRFICHKCTNIARQYAVSFSKCESATSELKASMKTPYMKRKLSQFSPKSSHVTPKRKKRITSTAVHKSMYVAQSTPMSSLPQSASVLVSKRRYGSAFRVLTSKNKSAHNSFRYCVKDAVRKEVISLCKQEHSSLAAEADMSTLTNFKWENVASEVSKQCPILWSALLAATTTRSTERNVTNKCGKNLLPTLSTIIGMLSYCRNPKKMKVIQQLIGVQMWLGGVKREVGTRLNVISLCQGLDSTMKTIDNLIKDSSKNVYEWKHAVTSYLRRPSCRRRLFVEDPEWIDEDDTSIPLSYSIVFDNVNQKTHARHQSDTTRNKMLNMVQAYAAQDRISSLHLPTETPPPEAILEIPIESYLPNEADIETLRHEFQNEIGKILNEHFHFIPPNIPDGDKPFRRESAQRSTMVPLGILKKDEARTGEMVDIMADYQRYVPTNPDGSPFMLPLWCDGLSCERGHDAQISSVNGRSTWSRLEGLSPSIQEWHRKQLQMEDLWKECYSTFSPREMGTLYHLRNILGMTNVESEIKRCMNHATEFANIVLDGYVTGAAMAVMGTDNFDQRPMDFPDSEEEQLAYKANIIDTIMGLAFHPPHLDHVLEDPLENECCCGEVKTDSTMIMCHNEGQCVGKMWYHMQCVGITKVPKGKWFCNNCAAILPTLDHKLEYSKIILWKLLNARVRHTAIRFNDGDQIMCHWKFDLVEFYLNKHPKYFIYAHRLLSSINGAASKQHAHVLKWNRTVNPAGGGRKEFRNGPKNGILQ